MSIRKLGHDVATLPFDWVRTRIEACSRCRPANTASHILRKTTVGVRRRGSKTRRLLLPSKTENKFPDSRNALMVSRPSISRKAWRNISP
eukprot:1390166-Amphidinium_carterae.1